MSIIEHNSTPGRWSWRSQITEQRDGLPSKTLISVIDDDESVREAIGGLVNWLGFQVRMFPSAVEFLSSPSVAHSSCVIADVQMPQMTGIELHKRLTQLGYGIPTILITAYPNEAVRDRVLADGVVCYLSKPLDNDTLIACIRSALDLHVR